MLSSIGERLAVMRHAYARTLVRLRDAQDRFTLAKAQAELRVIEEAGGEKGLATNEESRKRLLTVLIPEQPGYGNALRALRDAERERDILEAEILALRDLRRQAELDHKQAALAALIEASALPKTTPALAGAIADLAEVTEGER